MHIPGLVCTYVFGVCLCMFTLVPPGPEVAPHLSRWVPTQTLAGGMSQRHFCQQRQLVDHTACCAPLPALQPCLRTIRDAVMPA